MKSKADAYKQEVITEFRQRFPQLVDVGGQFGTHYILQKDVTADVEKFIMQKLERFQKLLTSKGDTNV